MPFRLVACVVVLALVTPLASAQEGGAPTDQDACRPDVFRLCAEAIPDESRIVACLNGKAAELSPACRAVIDPPARASHKRRRVKLTGLRGSDPWSSERSSVVAGLAGKV